MNEESGLSDQYPRASPWPLFVALGLALSELGVFIGLLPVAVFGLLLFGGSVAGILTESGYTARPWPTLLALGTLLSVAALAVVLSQGPLSAVDLANFGADGVRARGFAVLAAGVILAITGAFASLLEAGQA